MKDCCGTRVEEARGQHDRGEKPNVMAISVASMVLRTEAQPFTPQAHGTRARAPDQTLTVQAETACP